MATLRETVAGLEYELADAWAKHGKLAEENVRLREELRAAEQSLALARESLRRLPVADLDSSEVLLLQRLLAGDTASWEAARSLRSLASHLAAVYGTVMPGYTRRALPDRTAARVSSGRPSAATARTLRATPGTPGQSVPKIHLAARAGRSKPA